MDYPSTKWLVNVRKPRIRISKVLREENDVKVNEEYSFSSSPRIRFVVQSSWYTYIENSFKTESKVNVSEIRKK
ncbi:hypothetical protein HZH68_010082 [Vespula germanica]|uniref:Uncharacterized protein n=1 Tax=Vespula germanica TaxID=30212 RepID=A0A834N4K0_VESGE|nr:hypothetical protein HZH68_010082 [Vespula germanica]